MRVLRLIRRSATRGLAAYAGLFLLAQAGVPLLEASLAGRSSGQRSHVEAERAAACFAHDHHACQLCRVIRTVSLGAAPQLVAPISAPVIRAPRRTDAVPQSTRIDPSRSARAPPLA